MMDAQSKAMLDEILAQEPAALTDADKAFLRARRSYLTEEHRHVYAEALEQPEAEQADEASKESEAVEQPRTRRGRKTSEESEA